jgi:uncharacterized lipoprotein YddW (UPF0748 family)
MLRPLEFLHLAASLATGLAWLDLASTSFAQEQVSAAERMLVPRRALWITRWEWRTEEELRLVIEQAADAGFDTLLLQVRGTASTFWPSRLEPWAEELGGGDPGFDPLALALEEAHARGVAVHAWVNVMPSWRGTTAPRDPRHLWHSRPEWHWFDAAGRRQPLCEDFYVSLNPCVPEVREHLIAVCTELVERYAVDGLHLDYLRFPNEPPAVPAGQRDAWPRDERTLALFSRATGLESPEDSPDRWDQWRADAVTEVLRWIRVAVRAARDKVRLSAAVGPSAELAAHHYQDWPRWVEEGLLDFILPMNYSADDETFSGRLSGWVEVDRRVPVLMGVMAGGAPDEVRRGQLDQVEERFGRSCLFAYCRLWDSANAVLSSQDDASSRLRTERRQELLRRGPGGAGGPVSGKRRKP